MSRNIATIDTYSTIPQTASYRPPVAMSSGSSGARARVTTRPPAAEVDDADRDSAWISRSRALAWAWTTTAVLVMALGGAWLVNVVADSYGSEPTVDFSWSVARLSVDDVASRPALYDGRDVAVTGLVKVDAGAEEPSGSHPADSFELSDDDGPAFNDRVKIVNATGEEVRVVEDSLVEVEGRVLVSSEANPQPEDVVIVASRIHREDPADKLRKTIEPHPAPVARARE